MRATRSLVYLFAMFAAGPLFAEESEASAALDAVERALQPLIGKLDPKPEVTRSNENQSLEIAYFFMSVFVERWYLIRRLKDSDPTAINRTAWKMNLLTYGLLMLFAVGNLAVVASKSPRELARGKTHAGE